MTGRSQATSRPVRRRARRIAGGLSAAFLGILIVAAASYWYVADPDRVAEHVRLALLERLGANVSIGGAGFTWPGRIELRDLRFFDHPGTIVPSALAGEEASNAIQAVLSFTRADVTLDPAALWRGEFKVTDVRLLEPALNLNASSSHALRQWLETLRAGRAGETDPGEWPAFHIENASVTLASGGAAHGGARVWKVSANGAASGEDGDRYELRWRVEDPAEPPEAEGVLSIRLATGRIETLRGATPWLSIEEITATLDELDLTDSAPGQLDSLRRRYGARGRFRLCDVEAAWSDEGSASVQADVRAELDALSIPISEADADLPAEDRYVRIEHLRVEASLRSGRVDAGISADFHGAACSFEVEATADPGKPFDPFAAAVRVRGTVRDLQLPRRDGATRGESLLFAASPGVDRFWSRYSPEGRVDTEFELTKSAGASAPLEWPSVRVTALDCRAAYDRFPYVGEGITGSVEVTPLGIFVRELQARHGDGTIVLNAWTQDMGGPSATRVSIEGRNIGLDADLQAAMPSGFRAVWNQFSPSGRADLAVRIERPGKGAGRPNEWSNHIVAHLRDATLAYDAFPYPLRRVEGTVTLAEHAFEIENLIGRHDQSEIMLNGFVKYDDEHATDLDIHIETRDTPVNDALLTALPEGIREVVADVDPKGCFDASAAVYLDPATHRMLYDIDVFPRALTVCPVKAPLRVDDVTGRIRFEPDRIELDAVAGEHAGAILWMNGSYDLRQGGHAPDLTLRCSGLRLTEEVLKVLPVEVRRSASAWSIEGALAVESRVAPARETDEAPAMHHTIRLACGRLKHESWPLPLEGAEVAIGVDDWGVDSLDVHGVWNGARVAIRAARTARPGGGHYLKGSASAEGLALDDPLGAMLPSAMRNSLAALGCDGAVDFFVDSFEMAPAEDSAGDRAWSVTGRVRFDALRVDAAAELADASGLVTFSGDVNDPPGYASLHGLLKLDQARFAGKQVTELGGDWRLTAAPQGGLRLTIEDVEATAYGGAVTGEADVTRRGRTTDYEISLAAADIDLGSMLHDAAPGSHAGPSSKIEGRLDGRFVLTGRAGSTMSRRGDGRVAVRDARLYDLPIMLAILRVLNPAEQEETAAQEANVTFSLEGQRLDFHEIYLRDPATALAGNGTCSLPDRTVDLRLIAVSPHDWARLPVLSELVEGASRELMELEVKGPVGRPVVRPGPLRGLRNIWQTLFPEKAERGRNP